MRILNDITSMILVIVLLCPQLTTALFSSKFLVFPRIRCLLKLRSLNYDINAEDRFDEFYREDSVFQLVETGAYRGPDDILEYASGGSVTSPYFVRNVELEDLKFRYRRFDSKNGICEFHVTATNSLETDPTTTAEALIIKSGTMSTIFLDFYEGYIVKQNIYLLSGFWNDGLVRAYNSTKSRNFVCEVMATDCAPYLPIGAADDCLTRLEAIPMVESDDDGTVRFQEYSQLCRVLHSGLARNNAEAHCPHISFEPLEDKKGRIKCQVGSDKDNLKPLDLFTQKEIDDFHAYCIEQGLGERGAIVTPVR